MPGLKILISGERKKPAWITSRKADSATDATTSVFHHFSLMTLQRILFTVSNQKKSIETWSSTLKVGGVLGWGGPGMDRGMIFIFFGGGGVVSMICLYICWSLYLGKWFQSLRNIRSNGLKAPKGFLLVWWIGLGHLGPVAPTKMHEMRPYHILLQWMKVG